MADKAHESADRQLAEMERKLHEAYSRAEKEVRDTYESYFSAIKPKIDDALEALDEAKKGGDVKMIRAAQKRYTAMMNEYTRSSRRYAALVNSITERIAHENETALAYIDGKLPPIYAENFVFAEGAVSARLPTISFALLDENTVRDLIVSEDLRLPPPKKLDIPADKRWNRQHINAELTQGILQGESIPKIADRMIKVVGMNEVSAVRNARTMVTSAENKGRIDGMAKMEGDGVILDKLWIATDDNRTRHVHRDLDGQTRQQNQAFEMDGYTIMYPGDPSAAPEMVYNCRCSLGTKVIGFRSNLPTGKRGAIEVI